MSVIIKTIVDNTFFGYFINLTSDILMIICEGRWEGNTTLVHVNQFYGLVVHESI